MKWDRVKVLMTIDNHLAYLDNASTTPVPQHVVDVIDHYYHCEKVNVHRGMYKLANVVTQQYEGVRQKVAKFINADDKNQIVFTSGTTDSLNMVAFGYALSHLQPDDEMIVSVLEHHSNLVPWQQVAAKSGGRLRIVKVDGKGHLDQKQLTKMINRHTKVVSLAMVSNVLGTYTDMRPIAQKAHEIGAVLVVDAAQAVAHMPIDVQKMNVDFVAFSGHKMFGPTGVGVLYGKSELLEEMNPVRFGGEMIDQVTSRSATFQPAPLKFEAGTPNIAGVLGLGAAIDYINGIGYPSIMGTDHLLVERLMSELNGLKFVTIYGSPSADDHKAVVSFNVEGIHAHDIATILDSVGVAVRAGHHCAQPLMDFLRTESVVRASVSFQNTIKEIDQLVVGIQKAREIFK